MQNLVNLINFVRTWAGIGISDEEGQGLIEYVLIAALISIAAIAAIQLVGPQISAQFTAVEAAIP